MQQADTKPGFYYVSVIDGARHLKALGPFVNNHGLALDLVDTVRAKAIEIDPKAHFYGFGTCRTDEDAGPGKLNEVLGFQAPHI